LSSGVDVSRQLWYNQIRLLRFSKGKHVPV
jgi:hypothetical protein